MRIIIENNNTPIRVSAYVSNGIYIHQIALVNLYHAWLIFFAKFMQGAAHYFSNGFIIYRLKYVQVIPVGFGIQQFRRVLACILHRSIAKTDISNNRYESNQDSFQHHLPKGNLEGNMLLQQYGKHRAYHREMDKNPQQLFAVGPIAQLLSHSETGDDKIKGYDKSGNGRNEKANHPKVGALQLRHKKGLIQAEEDKDIGGECQAIDGVGFSIDTKDEAAVNPNFKFAHHLRRTGARGKKLLKDE